MSTVSSVSGSGSSYDVYSQSTSASASKASEQNTSVASEGAVYEKSQVESKATYSIGKMSDSQRSSLVEQMKLDQQNRLQQMQDLVSKLMGDQAKTSVISMDDLMGKNGNAKDAWAKLAENADPATIEQAKQDVSEDGYWGVKQTSQRLFDFAMALAGDDVDKMKEMQAAMEKGYKQAEEAWGGELPQISKDTLAAANKLFEDYYASKQVA